MWDVGEGVLVGVSAVQRLLFNDFSLFFPFFLAFPGIGNLEGG